MINISKHSLNQPSRSLERVIMNFFIQASNQTRVNGAFTVTKYYVDVDESGEDGEILEYTKSKWSVMLPKSTVVLPRAKAPPKKKELTKWERFR